VANDTKIAAVIGVSAAVGLGAWYYLKSKKASVSEEEEEPSIQEQIDKGASYDRPTSIRFRGGQDRGGGATAVASRADGTIKAISDGALEYRWHDTVTYTEPIFFGAKSYRHSRCVPVRSMPWSDQGGEKWLYGQEVRCTAGTAMQCGRTSWGRREFQEGSGWQTNGAALIAKSWSCDLSKRQGENNINCLTLRNSQNTFDLGRPAGGLGFQPFPADYGQRYVDKGGASPDGVPFIEYGSVSTGSQTGGRTYRNIAHRASKQGRGFMDSNGTVWVAGPNSLNFRYIRDENPDIIYHYAMKGRGGVRVAVNVRNLTRVPESQLKPKWMDLTHNESMLLQRMNSENYAKIDPWSIPGSPWNIMDRMEMKQFHVHGQRYDINYSRMRGGNPSLRVLASQSPAGAVRAVPRYVKFGNIHLASGYRWPQPAYGLIDPWRTVDPTNKPNAMPYDFAMPIWMHVWKDMDVDTSLRFAGDITTEFISGLASLRGL